MTTRREDDSRPKSNATSQHQTRRDVPLAKFREVPIGTSPPGALRGPSLLPGQGAPERIVPEQVELAVLRDAETMDGPNVARAAGKRQFGVSSSPPPVSVSVEVPRARSVAPALEELGSTPPSPSARSIQSGTLMSIGSVDPRAPTELSLPSPRPVSVSERAAYFGPEAVVDRSYAATLAPPVPAISRSMPSGGASKSGSTFEPESVAPPALHFARAPHSHPPLSRLPEPPAPPTPPTRAPQSSARPASAASRRGQVPPSSTPEVARRFQIHSEIDALQREPTEDDFDLRSARTQREPLAGRKVQPSSDWLTVHAPHAPAPEQAPIEAKSPFIRSSTSAITLHFDRDGDFKALRAAPAPAPARRAAEPVTWLLAGLCALVALLLAIWFARARSAQDLAHVQGEHAAAPASSAAPLLVPPSSRVPIPAEQRAAPAAAADSALRLAAPRLPAMAAKAVSAPAGSHSAAPIVHDSASVPPPPSPVDSTSKSHQSIY